MIVGRGGRAEMAYIPRPVFGSEAKRSVIIRPRPYILQCSGGCVNQTTHDSIQIMLQLLLLPEPELYYGFMTFYRLGKEFRV